MEKGEILKLVKEYYGDSLSSEKRKIILKLYAIYSKLEKLQTNDNGFSFDDYEDEIYNLDDTYLTDLGRIKLEIKYYLNTKDEKISKLIQNMMQFISKKEKSGGLTEDEILSLKQQLVEIQILTDHEVTFYAAAYKLFENYCYQEKENKKK